jgi:hypothetical protein
MRSQNVLLLAGVDEASTSESVAVPPGEVIIFFPGMPGCAKSALCKQLLGTDQERPKVCRRRPVLCILCA